MQLRQYRTTKDGPSFECAAHTKSEARQTFKRMIAKRVGTNAQGGGVFSVKSRLRSKVRLTKTEE